MSKVQVNIGVGGWMD